MAEDLVLDTAIRDWVLIPLSVVMVLIGVLRYSVSKLMRSSQVPDPKIVKEGQVIIRARNLRAAANFIPAKSFRARKAYYTNEDHMIHIPEGLVWEILRWLPAKSLMRFKCVSRIWLTIVMDPSFASAHRGGRRGLLVPSEPYKRLMGRRHFFYLSLPDDPNNNTDKLFSHHHRRVDHPLYNMGFTDLVNGLICFYNRNRSYLYNIATRETLELPLSNNYSQACSYHFGFDPVNKLYKLLKICPLYDEYDDGGDFVRNLYCEVLTIGVDSTWRIRDPPPPLEITSRGICLGELLCWMEIVEGSNHEENRLIAFHLVEEKFQVIPLPGRTIDSCCYFLPWFGPRLTLFFILPNGKGKTEVLMVGGGSEGGMFMWGDEQKFTLQPPRQASRHIDPRPCGILPNGKLVIYDNENFADRTIYLYDPSKRDLEKKIVNRLDSQFWSLLGHGLFEETVFYLEENIIPLRKLFQLYL